MLVGIVGLAAAAGLAGLVGFLKGRGMPDADNWASVIAAVLAYVVASVSMLRWAVQRAVQRASGTGDPAIAVRLRRAVRAQCGAVVVDRQLEQPRPLRLAWRATPRPVRIATSTRATRRLTGELVRDPLDPRRSAVLLAELLALPEHQQLVVLGEPGSGKSTMALLLTLELAGESDGAGPVPVLVSAAGWRPDTELLVAWLVRRTLEDHPELRSHGIEADLAGLVRDGRILPILDGLDEMPPQLLTMALRELDGAATAGLRTVLTCRMREFETAVGDGGPLSHAAVIEIEPVRTADAVEYLQQRELVGSDRWSPVLAAMRTDEDGPLAKALSTPLMIALARRVYGPHSTDPADLLRFPTRDKVQEHLLDRFLPTVYPDPGDARRAERWLGFLADHLRGRVGGPDLYWWQLAAALPRTLLAVLVTAAGVAAGGVFGLLFGGVVQRPDTVRDLVLTGIAGAVAGGLLGLIAGRQAGRVAHGRRSSAGRTLLGDLGALLTASAGALAASAGALGVYMLVLRLAAPPAAAARAVWLRRWVDWFQANQLPDPWLPFTMVLLVIVMLSLILTQAFFVGGTIRPRHGTPRRSGLLPSAGVGLGAGMFAVYLLLVAFAFGFHGTATSSVWFLSGAVAVVVALARWFSAPTDAPAASSPAAVLRSDRLFLLIMTLAAGAIFALAGAFVAWQGPYGPRGTAMDALNGAVLLGPLAAALVFVAYGGTWLTYTVARTWLAATGRLPWRLSRFLRQAHDLGVLRMAGPAYQIRHDLLRAHLADRWRAGQAPARPALQLSRRSRLLVAAGVATVLAIALPVAIVASDPATPPDRTLWHRADGIRPVSLHLDGGGVTELAIEISVTRVQCPDGHSYSYSADQRWRVSRWDPSGAAPATTYPFDRAATSQFPVDGCSGSRFVRLDLLPRIAAVSADGRTSLASERPTGDRDGLTLTGADRPVTAEKVTAVALDAAATWAAWLTADGTLHTRDLVAGRDGTLNRAGRAADDVTLAFSADGRLLTEVSMGSGRVWIWRPGDGELDRTVDTRTATDAVAVTSDGATLAALASNGIVRLFDTRFGRHVATVPYPGRLWVSDVSAIAFSADGAELATGAADAIRIWTLTRLVRDQR